MSSFTTSRKQARPTLFAAEAFIARYPISLSAVGASFERGKMALWMCPAPLSAPALANLAGAVLSDGNIRQD